jgi:hypothetical protein
MVNDKEKKKKFLINHINILLESSLLEDNIYFERNEIHLKIIL